jgi:hypothetical protein
MEELSCCDESRHEIEKIELSIKQASEPYNLSNLFLPDSNNRRQNKTAETSLRNGARNSH